MALEALGVAANVAGLIELGLSVCDGLCKYYRSWKDADDDVRKMFAEIESLSKTFAILQTTIARPSLDPDLVHRIEDIVATCEEGILSLHKKLQKIRDTSVRTGKMSTKFKAQIQRALYPFKESTLVKLKEITRELQDHLILALNILQVATSSESAQTMKTLSTDVDKLSIGITTLDDGLSRASKGVSKLTEAHDDQHLSAVHDWLSPLFQTFNSIQHETFNMVARQDGLGLRLMKSTQYKQWQSEEGKALWCLGSRGIGKTVLASFLINHLGNTKPAATGLAYLYCSYKDPQKHTALNMLGCVLQQLMLQCPYISDEIAEHFERHQKAKTQPSVQEYSTLLRSAVDHFTKTIIVVDALDECQDGARDTLMEEISRVAQGVSLLITSRHTLSVSSGEDNAITVKLEADNMDIKGYLEARLNTAKLLRAQIMKDTSLHNYVISSIVGKAKGMFLLARLQFDSIMAKPTVRKIKSALKDLPEELDLMYDQALERIKNQDPEFASLALKLIYWTHFAIRPLNVQELRHAVAVELGDGSFDEEGLPDKDLIEPVCSGLLTIQENGTVGLVHYTAQEYLKRHSTSLFPRAHAAILQTCLTYLSFDDFSNGPCSDDASFVTRCDRYPLILYASRHWAHHLHFVGEDDSEQAVLAFLSLNEQLSASIQAAQVVKSRYPFWSQLFSKDVTGLWLASSYGLLPICTKLLGGGADPSQCDSHGQAPLHRAAINDSVDVVQLLLNHNVDLEARCLDFSRTPLHWAAWHGHTGIVNLLIDRGAQVGSHDEQRWTALHLAASQGHQETIDLLLRKHVEIDAKDGYGATALYRAAEGGHEGAAQLLLIEGARPDIPNDYDQTPLHRAADLGRLGTARMLLNHGAPFNVKDYYGWTPLYRAADHGHNEVADLLADFAEATRKRSSQQVFMLQSGSETLVTRKSDSHVTPKHPACGEDLLLEN